eukprot:gene3794-8373_t
MSNFAKWGGLVIATISLFAAFQLQHPPVKKDYPYKIIQDIWTPEEQQQLADMVRTYGEIQSAVADQTPLTESIGESKPYDPIHGCTHPLMVPTRDGKQCAFAGRLDVGRHYIRTGGHNSLKEPYESLVSRLLSFAKFFIGKGPKDLSKEIPLFEKLFNNSEYKSAVETICHGHPHLEPFQLGIIVQIPGQTVAMHYDAPWFFGADRMTVPIWLLVVMHASGLFHNITVPQIQGVAYIHPWNVENMTDSQIADTYGGSFFYHSQGPGFPAGRLAPRPGNAILLDGSKCIHGTDLFLPPNTTSATMLNKDAKPKLVFSPKNSPNVTTRESLWDVISDGKTVATYKFSQLRIALVWRSKCFKSKEEQRKYDEAPKLKVEEILNVLKDDLIRRNRLDLNTYISPERLGVLLLDEYVDYPLPVNTWMPYNYCAIPRLFGETNGGFVSSLLQLIC